MTDINSIKNALLKYNVYAKDTWLKAVIDSISQSLTSYNYFISITIEI